MIDGAHRATAAIARCARQTFAADPPRHFAPAPARGIRAKDAPRYLGMDRNRFNRLVRPYVTLIQYGPQTKVFDRLELDRWFEDYKRRNGRPAHRPAVGR